MQMTAKDLQWSLPYTGNEDLYTKLTGIKNLKLKVRNVKETK